MPVCFLLQAKTRELKLNLNNEFRSIHELCMFVLGNTRKVELLRATLTALAAYLSWVPPGESSIGLRTFTGAAYAAGVLVISQLCSQPFVLLVLPLLQQRLC